MVRLIFNPIFKIILPNGKFSVAFSNELFVEDENA